jgi:hypothetical protein
MKSNKILSPWSFNTTMGRSKRYDLNGFDAIIIQYNNSTFELVITYDFDDIEDYEEDWHIFTSLSKAIKAADKIATKKGYILINSQDEFNKLKLLY